MYAYHKYRIYVFKWQQQKKDLHSGGPFMQVVSPC